MSWQKPTLTITNLTTGYCSKNRQYPVSEHLCASLFAGELTCLLGANGSGKSTLLRTLTSFLQPLAGEIYLLDKPLSQYSRDDMARLVGVVLTDKVEVRDMCVRDLVAMGRMPYTGFWGRLSTSDEVTVNEAMNSVGIAYLAQRSLHSLSDGEMQKALIAKTLAQETPFIFLDEPSAFLDYASKVDLFMLLRRLAVEKQKTIFMSTHDLDLVLQMADRLWLLHESEGLHTGIPEDLVALGYLDRLFRNDNLKFSAEQMSYYVQMPLRNDCRKHNIQLVGTEGQNRKLLQRALNRMGMSCMATEAEAKLQICIAQETPIYTLKKQADILKQTDLIGDLLQEISACMDY